MNDAYSLLAEAQKALEIVRDNYGLQDHSLLARIAALLAKGPPCTKCGQVDHGQTGEYPCPVCGLPLTHDALLAKGPPAAPEVKVEPACWVSPAELAALGARGLDDTGERCYPLYTARAMQTAIDDAVRAAEGKR